MEFILKKEKASDSASKKEMRMYIGNDWLHADEMVVKEKECLLYNDSNIIEIALIFNEGNPILENYRNEELQGDDVLFILNELSARRLAKHLLKITEDSTKNRATALGRHMSTIQALKKLSKDYNFRLRRKMKNPAKVKWDTNEINKAAGLIVEIFNLTGGSVSNYNLYRLLQDYFLDTQKRDAINEIINQCGSKYFEKNITIFQLLKENQRLKARNEDLEKLLPIAGQQLQNNNECSCPSPSGRTVSEDFTHQICDTCNLPIPII